MSRTKRKVHPRIIVAIKDEPNDLFMVEFLARHPKWQRRNKRLLRGQDGAMSSDKHDRATIDRHGNWKLNTWTTIGGSKKSTRLPQRQQRLCGKIIIRLAIKELIEDEQVNWLEALYDDQSDYLDFYWELEEDDYIDEPYDDFYYEDDIWYVDDLIDYMEE